MLKLFKYLKPYWLTLALLIILTYAQVLANLQLPGYMAKIVNEGIMVENMSSAYQNGITMLAITLGGGIAAMMAGYLASRIATGFARDIRQTVFTKIESFSIAEFKKFSTASLITRSTNDVQQVQMVMVMLLRMVLIAPFMAVGALQNALQTAPEMSWIIAVAVLALMTVIITLLVVGLPKFNLLQTLVDKLNLVARENLTGLRVIRAFNNERVEEEKFDITNKELTDLNLFVNRLTIILQPFMMFLMNVTLVVIVWFGAHLVSGGVVQIGNMMAFMQYATQVIMSFLMISIIFIMIPRASVSAKRIEEVISTKLSVTETTNPQKPNLKGSGEIEFRDVSFAYPDADSPVLSKINFKAKSGETTAFIGSTGSGKTTLISLIPRFYDVTAGQILLDGIDVRDMKLESLYQQIGYVPQKGVLFSGSVESNVKYGNKNASENDVRAAIKTAQAEEFVAKLKDGLKSNIAQGGANVSGGQKQRLSIARALTVKPKVYIFDDSFSALDFKTDASLRKALKKETLGKTVLIVAQRISTIMDADKIIVLNEGKIVGQGTHLELMKTNKVYKEIAQSQLSDEELGVKK